MSGKVWNMWAPGGPKQVRATKKRRYLAAGGPGQIYQTVPRTRGWAANPSEMKYFDTFKANTALVSDKDWNGTEFDPVALGLFQPKRGAAINERISRRVRLYKIKIRMTLDFGPAVLQNTGANPANIRVLLVQDKQTNAVQMAGESCMTSETTSFLAILSFLDLDSLGRFNILKDKKIILQNPNQGIDAATLHSQNGMLRQINLNYTWKQGMEVHFNELTTGTITDIVDNSFHVLINCSNLNLGPTVNYVARMSYKDF